MELRFSAPSYLKIALSAALWALMVAVPVGGFITLRIEAGVGPVEAPHEPFEEYSAARRDAVEHPSAGRSAVWLSYRHLPADRVAAAAAAWERAPGFTPVGPGVYRVDCRGEAAREFRAAAESYPYAIAPGPRVDPGLAADYRAVAALSPFAAPVVRGDWLLAAAADRPALASALSVRASPAAREAYLDEPAGPPDVFTHPGAGRTAAPGPPLRRRDLERDGGRGSLFGRLAAEAGFGVPVL